jgi:hypothetical protein
MTIINNPNDLYKLILKENLNVKQVNTILESFLNQKSFIVFNDYTPIQIVEILKEFFIKYTGTGERPIFIDFKYGNLDIKDLFNKENNLIKFV